MAQAQENSQQFLRVRAAFLVCEVLVLLEEHAMFVPKDLVHIAGRNVCILYYLIVLNNLSWRSLLILANCHEEVIQVLNLDLETY